MERPVITISDGKVQGIILKSVLGSNYLAFKGIPYAQPPIGPLRFKEPQPPLKWSGLLDASKDDKVALQFKYNNPQITELIGSEDCLYLNIFTNAIGHKRPVMFYIHGGMFMNGSKSVYGPDYLIETDAILITFNYRLGPFGFLNLGHEVASGNQGIRDMIFALKWVKNNIDKFGGDPDNITVFGHSSGASTCHLLTLLPMANNLFQKVIIQSGTVLRDNVHKYSNFKNGFRIAELLGMNSKDPTKVLEFLSTVPAEKLVLTQTNISTESDIVVLSKFPYIPVVDAEFSSNPVIPAPIDQLFRNNINMPMMIGQTPDECLISLRGHFDDAKNYKFYSDNIDEIIKNILPFNETQETSHCLKIIKQFYLNNKPINKENVWNLIHLLTDICFLYLNQIVVDIRNECNKAPTYVYNFSYLGNEPTIYMYDFGPQPLKGIAHADELSYLFYLPHLMKTDKTISKKILPLENNEDKLVMEKMIKMWYNFAATGNPTPDNQNMKTTWQPSSKNNLYYLDIGKETVLKNEKNLKSRAIYEEIKKYLNFISDF